jgi:hypothetical protein
MVATNDLNIRLADSYLALLKNMSADMRLELIAKLSASLKSTVSKKHTVDYYNGIWNSSESAEEIIENIRNARVSTRQIENF